LGVFQKSRPLMVASVMLCIFGGATAAKAAHWVMIAREGEQPQRSVHYLALDEVKSTLDLETFDESKALAMKAPDMARYMEDSQVHTAFVVQVMEGKADPDTIQYTVDIRCNPKQFRVTNAYALYRNNESEKMNSPEWAPIPDNWVNRVYLVACKMQDKVAPAVQKFYDASKKIQENPNATMKDKAAAMQPLAELGMIYATEIPLISYIQLSDYSWSHLWLDGKRPPYTATKSREEIEKDRAELEARMASLSSKAGQVEQKIAGMDAERLFMEKVAANFRKKNDAQRERFYSMQGWSEKEIVDFWGAPNAINELAGTKSLRYISRVDTRQVVVDNIPVYDSRGGVVGMNQSERVDGELSECDLTLFLEQGGSKPGHRLVDYKLNGTNCRVDTLGRLVR
ncbi:MAG TPA: hypothetical protein VFV06_03245, partial [Sphingorhabdus sp.]|nr:hypothetical protein [Sphingorhabdus sp.]